MMYSREFSSRAFGFLWVTTVVLPFLVGLSSWRVNGDSADSVVVFNEIQFQPGDELKECEWIELRNLMGVTVDLSGWRLEGGAELTFAEGTRIDGRGFLIVSDRPDDPQFAGLPVYDRPFSGRLANEGETIRLTNRSGRVMDRLRYRVSGEWPVGPTGSGASLAKWDEESAAQGPENWGASSLLGGTPGRRNVPLESDSGTVIDLIGPDDEWRYYNTGRAAPNDWADPQFDSSQWLSGKAMFRAGTSSVQNRSPGLYAYWKLDKEGGSVATEEVSGRESELREGAAWVMDRERGSVIEFDGDNGFVDTGIHIPRMTLENDFTWSFWAFSRRPANVNVILGNRHRANGADFSPREFIKFTNGGLEFHRQGAGEDILYPPIPRNEWVHHAAVKRGASLTYYRNGEIQGRQRLSQGLENPQPLYFGGDQTRENWRGRLDEVGLWEVALSDSSIVGLADGSFTPETAPAEEIIPLVGGTEITGVSQTAYFVTAFQHAGDVSRTELAMNVLVDDGAVVYLNGREVYRQNMPSGTIDYDTPASQSIDDAVISEPINLPTGSLRRGRNVLAVEVHQASAVTAMEDVVFGLTLVGLELPPQALGESPLRFNEVSSGSAEPFLLELANVGADVIDLNGYEIRSFNQGSYRFAEGTLIPAGNYSVLDNETMGLKVEGGDRFFLIDPSGTRLLDAMRVKDRLQARRSAAPDRWFTPPTASFGRENPNHLVPNIVINEIMYDPSDASSTASEAGRWIELFNGGDERIDLSGWNFNDGIRFLFPEGTVVAPGHFLLVVEDQTRFGIANPEIDVIGEWTGSLSRRGERLRLVDAVGNVVDEVRFYDGGRWPRRANGGGSSLELMDPRADNFRAEAWAASLTEGEWQVVSYRGRALNGRSDPTRYNEFVLGLLDEGEFLVDDISVIEEPDGVARQLIQNGDFEGGTTQSWRILGNHSEAAVVEDPNDSGNQVLWVNATGPTEHMSNHLETTLRTGDSYVRISERREYEISFRVKWLGGSNQLHSRLYFNRLARTTALNVRRASGSPGLANSTLVRNLGPTFKQLSHHPAVPGAQEPVVVRVKAEDPDGLAGLTLFYSLGGRRFNSLVMQESEGFWSATIPGQDRESKIQFFVEGLDQRGVRSRYPAGGESSAAFIPIADGQADLDYGDCQPMNVRIVMSRISTQKLHASENVMSNQRLGCTVIVDERKIYYNAGVRLKGSEHGRASDVRVGYNIRFPADDLFLGAHETIAIDRSGAGDQFSQREIMVKHAINHAGGIPGSYDDLIRVIAPRPQHTGSAMLSKARFDREFLENQFENGSDGSLFEYELIYVLSGTTGGVEGEKVTQPGEVAGVGMRDLGGRDKELYRWHWLLKNNRRQDDFDGLIGMLSALGQSGRRFRIETEQRLDVNQWLRAFAIQVLFGVADNYASGARHNAMFYQRPSDGKFLYFPWDMDFTFVNGTSSSLTPNGDLERLIAADDRHRRDYYRHVWEILQTTFHPDYLSEWTKHYSCFLPSEDLTRFDTYIRQRRNFALSEIERRAPHVPFSISTADQTLVNGTSVTLEGRGWVNIDELRLSGGGAPAIEWTEWDTWKIAVPIHPGQNRIEIQAVDPWGQTIGTDEVEIVGRGQVAPATGETLAISELMYHPGPVTEAERAGGWEDSEAFEFVELANLSSDFSIDLGGVAFTAGIQHQFPNTLVAPGERVVLARNLAAFQARYGREIRVVGEYQRVAGNRLSNGGERLQLNDAGGETIALVEWADRDPWPRGADGDGYSMVMMRPGFDEPSVASAWRHSVSVGGNPGASDSVPLERWAEAFEVDDLEGDEDGDGWGELMEYFAGTDPRQASDRPRVRIGFVGENADGGILEIEGESGRDDVVLWSGFSSDLDEWFDEMVYVGRWKDGEGQEVIRFRSPVPASEVGRQFFRLDIERVGPVDP